MASDAAAGTEADACRVSIEPDRRDRSRDVAYDLLAVGALRDEAGGGRSTSRSSAWPAGSRRPRPAASFWENLVAGRDCTGDVPADRWDPAVFFDPDSTANDRVYCQRGGYLDAPIEFDPAAHGVMPLAVAGGEPEQFLVLDAAAAALADAGYAGGRRRRPSGRGRHRPGQLLQPREPDPAPARPDRGPDAGDPRASSIPTGPRPNSRRSAPT